MHLITIIGFLGSGKTTLLLQLAHFARKHRKKVAILVNEVGEIGVDDQMIQRLGFDVRKLLGGCICCTLSGDIIETIETLQRSEQPDLVLIEPSGAANPRNLIRILDKRHSDNMEKYTKIALIDPLRLDALMTVASPLIISSLESADMILINKADAATTEEMNFARQTVLAHSPNVPVTPVSAKSDLADWISMEVFSWPNSD